MISRIKFWLLAAALGILPLVAFALLPRPIAAAGLSPAGPAGGNMGTVETQTLAGSDKTVDLAESLPGQPLHYTIRINNAGNSLITGIAVTDTLPAGLIYSAGWLTATSGSYNFASGVITWTGSVSAATTVVISFDASSLPSPAMGTVFTNTALFSGGGQAFSRSATTTLAPARLYLPIVMKSPPPPGGIQGYVTINGAPASGIFLELRHYDGHMFSTALSTNTDGNGFYNFSSAPSLPAGQYYYVRYLNNQTNTSLLSFWGTANINSYTAGSAVAAGSFDLADVTLVAPGPGARVTLPALFQWVRRPATPSDSYQLSLFDPNGTAFAQTGLLGYVNGVNVTNVPGIFHPGTRYGWFVAIITPDGGYGETYYYFPITFNNSLASTQPAVVGGAELSPTTPLADRPRR